MDSKTESWFVSDLHLFSRRSSAPQQEKMIRSAVQRSHTFVLGGDIFDFRWSTHRNMRHSIQDSMTWLQRLFEVNPECKFYYLLGNHDCHPRFVEALDRLSQTAPQLSWQPHMLRLGESVFLHGDIVDTRVRSGQVHHEVLDAKRIEGEMRKPPTQVSHALYDMAVQARVHRLVVQLAKRRKLVLRRLTRYLRAHSLDGNAGVRQVYFGHTHRRLLAIPHAGMEFYNPGAAIKGLPFQMVEIKPASSVS